LVVVVSAQRLEAPKAFSGGCCIFGALAAIGE
jgi:hypothetical protein